MAYWSFNHALKENEERGLKHSFNGAYWSFDHRVSDKDIVHCGRKGMKWGKRKLF